jgi:hypothetical protein
MFKYFILSLFLVATVTLYGCGGGGSSSTLVQLVSITVTPASPAVAVGATQQFTATGTYIDDTTKDLTSSVTWSSSNVSIATITSNGMATAVAAGQTTITATYNNAILATTDFTVTTPLIVSTLAGMSGVYGFADGTGFDARFNIPYAVTKIGTDLYVADTLNHTIRKITATGDVTTIAGLPGSANNTHLDGPVADARFTALYGITTDGTNLYVTEGLSNTIRKIVISTGNVSTIAGAVGVSGSADSATGTSAQFNQPMGITTDGSNLYVADNQNGSIRKIDSSGAVTTFAVIGGNPVGITTDMANLYVTDQLKHIIIKINISTKAFTTFAGLSGSSGYADGTGATARFYEPYGITTDGINLYVADYFNGSIRKIGISTAKVTTVTTYNTSKPLGITMIGSTLYTTGTDYTITSLTGGLIY